MTSNTNNFLSEILPNYNGEVSKASSTIDSLLNGNPSPDTTRTAAANFGAANGLGTGSGLTGRFGYDLYNQMGQKNQQTGIQNLLQLIQGVSSPILSNQGQNLQNNQFNAQLDQNGQEFNRTEQDRQSQQLAQLISQLSGDQNN